MNYQNIIQLQIFLILLEAIRISKVIKYSKGLAQSYLNYSVLNTQQGQYDIALENALKSKFIQDSLNDYEGLMLSNSTLTQIYILQKRSMLLKKC